MCPVRRRRAHAPRADPRSAAYPSAPRRASGVPRRVESPNETSNVWICEKTNYWIAERTVERIGRPARHRATRGLLRAQYVANISWTLSIEGRRVPAFRTRLGPVHNST